MCEFAFSWRLHEDKWDFLRGRMFAYFLKQGGKFNFRKPQCWPREFAEENGANIEEGMSQMFVVVLFFADYYKS